MSQVLEPAPKTATVVPKHGNGRLLPGGQHGNSGGPGRPPDAFKAACRELANGGLERIGRIARGEADESGRTPQDVAAIAAWRALVDAGFDKVTTQWTASVGVRELIQALPQVLTQHGIDSSLVRPIIESLASRVKEVAAEMASQQTVVASP